MYVIACGGVPTRVRDYRACQHMLGECYSMIGHAKMCLGILVMARCSKMCEVPRNASLCQSMLSYARTIEEC